MIELKNNPLTQSNKLVASFPDLPHQPELSVDFQRTLRIPDDGRTYPLPPGLAAFPLRHLDDYASKVPESWLKRGGVLLPMWQAEALWLRFRCGYVANRAQYPFAVKIATGKVSAITGEQWRRGLSRNPQDYLVAPKQPWLDGYCVEKGVIRQFVAMPLGDGYSVEEQLTGDAEFGGLQIEIFPMRTEVFERRFPIIERKQETPRCLAAAYYDAAPLTKLGMGLAPGGRMRQEIYEDPFSIHDWDTENSSRCFIHIVNSAMWRTVTGELPPTQPPTAKEYTKAGLPWFDYYDAELKALDGSKILAGVKTVKEKGDELRTQPLPENGSVAVVNIHNLRAGLKQDQVREGDFA